MTDEPLPSALSIFPLLGVVLLPGNSLPLHIFETRYRNLVEDALAGAGVIGMIQPVEAASADEDGEGEAEATREPELYSVGCVGRIHRSQKLPDGRYLILLVGLSRFRVQGELPGRRGYRRVAANYDEFRGDGLEAAEPVIDLTALLAGVRTFGVQRGLEVDLEELRAIPPPQLINGLAAALPFAPAEKQALLEAPDPLARAEVLSLLLAMSASSPDPDEPEPAAN